MGVKRSHPRAVTTYLFDNLHITECQLDELWSFELTFRTLFRTAEAILAEPLVERGAGARYRLCHAL